MRRKQTTLPDAVTMLTRAGIDPDGPLEVEVMRLTKQMKKAAAQAPGRGAASKARASQIPGVGRQEPACALDARSGKS